MGVVALGPSRQFTATRERVLGLVNAAPGEVIVDVGAGIGLLTFDLARAVSPGGRIFAIEPEQTCRQRLEQARTELGLTDTVQITAGAAESLPLPNQCADALVLRSVLIYVADWQVAFREFARVLRPGGRVICQEPIGAVHRHSIGLHKWFDLAPLGEVGAIVADVETKHLLSAGYRVDFGADDLIVAAESAGFSRMRVQVEEFVDRRELSVRDLKAVLGWQDPLTALDPPLLQLLSDRLSEKQMEELLLFVEAQLPGRKLRTRSALAVLVAEKD